MQFTKATKTAAKLRLSLMGPAGSGKTYSALKIASALSSKIAVIDTEHGSAAKYADEFTFDTLKLLTYAPDMYIAALTVAEQAGYEVIIVDSLSHAWAGKDGALEMVDREKIRSRSQNGFFAWRNVTPLWQQLMDKLLSLDAHVIGTFRSKTEYILEKDDQGKTIPQKIGLAPIFRDGAEFEFDIVGELNHQHQLIIGKTRCKRLDGMVFDKPGTEFAGIVSNWLKGNEPIVAEEPLSTTVLTSTPAAQTQAAPQKTAKKQATTKGRKKKTEQQVVTTSPTLAIEQLGRELYHDMWEEKSEEIAWWASGHRTRSIVELNDVEKGRVLDGMHEKLKQAA